MALLERGRKGPVPSFAVAAGALDGALWCVLARHGAHGLVGLPDWILAAAATVTGAVVLACAHRRAAIAAMAAGGLSAASLPLSLPPPRPGVITHVSRLARGVELFSALDQVDDNPQAWEGRRISVAGLWQPKRGDTPAAVYQTVMACCAADAINVGFDVIPAAAVNFAAGTAVAVTGTVASAERSGDIRYELIGAAVAATHAAQL